jgi:DNA-binding transcriptional LysR family regulator
MPVDLRHFRHFVEVADELSFTRAAERLGVSTQALSASMRRLESELGCQLLWRDTHKVELTDDGARLLAHAREVLAAADAALRSPRAGAQGPTRRLRLGASPVARFALLPPLLHHLARHHPEVEPAVREEYADPLQEALLRRALDVALLYCPRPRSGLRYELLHREPAAVALSPDHPHATSPTIPLGALAQDTFIIAGAHASGFNAHVIEACRSAGFEPRITTSDLPYSLAFDQVRDGLAVTVGCSPALRALAPGCVVRETDPPLLLPWELAWPTEGATKIARQFVALACRVRDEHAWLVRADQPAPQSAATRNSFGASNHAATSSSMSISVAP